MRTRSFLLFGALAVGCAAPPSLGISGGTTSGSGGAATSSSTAASSAVASTTSGSGGATSSSTAASSAVASSSAGGAPPQGCTPGATQPCYTGPPGTAGVGACKQGTQTCTAEGMSFGPCMGEVLPLPEVCGTNVDADCDGMPPPACAAAWNRFVNPAVYALGLVGGAAGDVFLAGVSGGNADFGDNVTISMPGTTPLFLLHLDAGGAILSNNVFAHAGAIVMGPSGLAWSGNDLVLASSADGPVDFGAGPFPGTAGFVVKLDTMGSPIWAVRTGAGGQRLSVDAAGNVLVATENLCQTQLGSCASFTNALLKLSPSGAQMWSHPLGSIFPLGIAMDAQGSTFITGTFSGTVTFASSRLSDGGALGVIFLGKIDASGNELWGHVFVPMMANTWAYAFDWYYSTPGMGSGVASAGTSLGVSVVAAPNGDVVMGGIAAGPIDLGGGVLPAASLSVVVGRYTSAGTHVWSHTFGGPNANSGPQLALGPNGEIDVIGSNRPLPGNPAPVQFDFGGGPLPPGLCVARLAADGSHLASKNVGPPSAWGWIPLVNAAGALYTAGDASTGGKIGLGPPPISGLGSGVGFFVSRLP
jgi:hypothetical protein